MTAKKHKNYCSNQMQFLFAWTESDDLLFSLDQEADPQKLPDRDKRLVDQYC